jgi:hypothetical protein
MNKEEILKLIDEPIYAVLHELAADGTLNRKQAREKLLDMMAIALDRYALSIVDASVPEPTQSHDIDGVRIPESLGFNSCRTQTLLNAKKLLNVGGETKNAKE